MERAASNGVDGMISQSTSLEDLAVNLQIAAEFDRVWTTVGIHPCDVMGTCEGFLEVLRRRITESKVVAIGETGLDYFHGAPDGVLDEIYFARQREFFRQHCELAKQTGLPLVIHTRDRKGADSFLDALGILAEFELGEQAVFHCFPGNWEMASRALAVGAMLSFTGVVTFKNGRECLECAAKVPLSRIMVETDAPYLAPEPYRGKRCEPAWVRQVAEEIAVARGLSLEEFAEATTANAKGFFRLV